jgi:diguanylate cyclase (GGDEF)-like protein
MMSKTEHFLQKKIGKTYSISTSQKLLILFSAAVIYLVLYPWLINSLGVDLFWLVLLPIFTGACLYGIYGGILSALLAPLCAYGILALTGLKTAAAGFSLRSLPEFILLLAFGCLIGGLRDLTSFMRRRLETNEAYYLTLKRREGILEAIGFASQQLLRSSDWKASLDEILARIGAAAGADHVYFGENALDAYGELGFSLTRVWSAAGPGDRRLDPFMQWTAYRNSFSFLAAEMSSKKVITGRKDSQDGSIRRFIDDLGLCAFAGAPVYSEDEWIGFLGLDHYTDSTGWTAAEVEALRTAADMLAAARRASIIEAAEDEQRNLAEALRDTAAALSSLLSVADVLDRILAYVARVVPFDGVSLTLIESGQAQIVRSRGYEDHTPIEQLNSLRMPVMTTPNLRHMISTRRPLLIRRTIPGKNWVDFPQTAWIRSYLGAPIVLKGDVIGFINLDSQTPDFFTETHAEHLQAFADQAAVAIENARLFEETRQNAHVWVMLNEITSIALSVDSLPEMLNQVVGRLKELFGADDLVLSLWDPDNQVPVMMASTGSGLPALPHVRLEPAELNITRLVLESKRVYVAENPAEIELIGGEPDHRSSAQAVFGIPLIADEEKLGSAIFSYDHPHHFTPGEIAMGIQAGAQTAMAIARVQMLENERSRIAQLTHANSLISALAHVATRIETAPDPGAVMETLGIELTHIGLNCLVAQRRVEGDAQLETLYISAVKIHPAFFARWVPAGLSSLIITREAFPYYAEVIEQRKSVFIHNPENILNPLLVGIQNRHIRQISRMVDVSDQTKGSCLPLMIEENVMGMLLVWGSTLTESDIPAITIFASQVAIAIENSGLYTELQKSVVTDELTGMLNRRGLIEVGEQMVEFAQASERSLAIIMIDIDRFKAVNDTYGHTIGDEVLRLFADRCRLCIRDNDALGRYGGEEFIVLLADTHPEETLQIAERLRVHIADWPFGVGSVSIPVTISLGIAMLNSNLTGLEELIARADKALYEAKQMGRNCISVAASKEIFGAG